MANIANEARLKEFKKVKRAECQMTNVASGERVASKGAKRKIRFKLNRDLEEFICNISDWCSKFTIREVESLLSNIESSIKTRIKRKAQKRLVLD